MRYTLSNEIISISVDSHGAELKSLVKNGREYMWQADAAYWARTAPVLFPMVGSLKDQTAKSKDISFSMGQHGFARDAEFALETQTESSLTFVLNASDDTKARYPFDFQLKIQYSLEGSCVRTQWIVSQAGTEPLYFSIGGHPAFNCTQDADAFLLLEADDRPLETLVYHELAQGGLVIPETVTRTCTEAGVLPIYPALFDKDALVVTESSVRTVCLLDAARKPYLTFRFDPDCEIFGLWSPVGKAAPFVCIEPWYGTADFVDADGIWEHKKYIHKLEIGKVFERGYTIEV